MGNRVGVHPKRLRSHAEEIIATLPDVYEELTFGKLPIDRAPRENRQLAILDGNV